MSRRPSDTNRARRLGRAYGRARPDSLILPTVPARVGGDCPFTRRDLVAAWHEGVTLGRIDVWAEALRWFAKAIEATFAKLAATMKRAGEAMARAFEGLRS